MQACLMYGDWFYPTGVHWVNVTQPPAPPPAPPPPPTALQMALAAPVRLMLPRLNPKACLRRCTEAECPLSGVGFPAGAERVVFDDDCSQLADTAKAWVATEQLPGWWQFADFAGNCLHVHAQDAIYYNSSENCCCATMLQLAPI